MVLGQLCGPLSGIFVEEDLRSMVSIQPTHCVLAVGLKLHDNMLFEDWMFVKETLNDIVTIHLSMCGWVVMV